MTELCLSLRVQLTLETRIVNWSFASDRKKTKMDDWDIQEEYQAPDNVPAGLALEPAIPEMEQVMRWIGFDELKARRVAAQIGERISDFAELSHSDVKMLTESLRGLPSNIRIHVSLAQAKKIKATIDTEPTRRLRLAVWTRSHSSVP
jgi:hypothetical protein